MGYGLKWKPMENSIHIILRTYICRHEIMFEQYMIIYKNFKLFVQFEQEPLQCGGTPRNSSYLCTKCSRYM